MEYTESTLLRGRAGELLVASQLLIRGINCAEFETDDGCDFVLKNGKKIQVKTSIKPYYSKTSYSWRYSFSIRQAQFRGVKGKNIYEKRHTRKSYREIDYFVFVCWEDSIFYIVPENEIGEKVSFTLPTPNQLRSYKRHKKFESASKYEKYKNNWELLR